MSFDEKILSHTRPSAKKRFTKDHFLIIVSLASTVVTVIILMAIVRKNAPAQVVVGDLEKKAKVTIKNIDWKKSLIDTPLFQQLKNPLPAPLEVGTVGNPRPFVE